MTRSNFKRLCSHKAIDFSHVTFSEMITWKGVPTLWVLTEKNTLMAIFSVLSKDWGSLLRPSLFNKSLALRLTFFNFTAGHRLYTKSIAYCVFTHECPVTYNAEPTFFVRIQNIKVIIIEVTRYSSNWNCPYLTRSPAKYTHTFKYAVVTFTLRWTFENTMHQQK